MSDFGLIRPFDIDDGKLDGLSPQQCFVLGYELCMIDRLLESGEGFARTIHAENEHRIKFACNKARRYVEMEWMADDASESWMTMTVAPKDHKREEDQ